MKENQFIFQLKKSRATYFIRNFFGNNRFKIKPSNKLNMGKSLLKNCYIEIRGRNNYVDIGDGCNLNGMRILMTGNNGYISLGKYVTINASRNQRTILSVTSDEKIIIGDSCLLSNNIEIHTSDYHSILNLYGERINVDKSVIIGPNVWIGLRCILLKNTKINSGCIVAAYSLLNKDYNENNCIIGGIPAKIIKRDVLWDSRNLTS